MSTLDMASNVAVNLLQGAEKAQGGKIIFKLPLMTGPAVGFGIENWV